MKVLNLTEVFALLAKAGESRQVMNKKNDDRQLYGQACAASAAQQQRLP